jgi:hypothetical protein
LGKKEHDKKKKVYKPWILLAQKFVTIRFYMTCIHVCWNKLENQVNLLGCDPYVAWGKWIGSNVGSSLKFVI